MKTKRWQLESNPCGYWVFDSERDEDGEPDRTAQGFTTLAAAEAFAAAQNASEPLEVADVLTVEDARLIAAAPELLEVLNSVRGHYIPDGQMPENLKEMIVRVIAKAEGTE